MNIITLYMITIELMTPATIIIIGDIIHIRIKIDKRK